MVRISEKDFDQQKIEVGLPDSLDLVCKLSSDDTILGDVEKDLIKLIFRLIKKLKVILDWCCFNRQKII